MDMISLFQKIARQVAFAVILFAMLLLAPSTFAAPTQSPANIKKTTPAKTKLPANYKSPLGINTNEALEVDSSLPFVDLFRLALPFDF